MKKEECESFLAHVVQRQKYTFEAGSRTKEREEEEVLMEIEESSRWGTPLVCQAWTPVFTMSMIKQSRK